MQPISFGERLTTAFVSIAATAIMPFVLPLIASVIAHNGKPLLIHGWILSKLAKHIFENDMLNGEVIHLDGAIRLAPK